LRRAFSFPAPVALKGFPPVRYKSSETTKHTDDMWVQRLSTGLYRVGVTKKLTDSLGGIGFVDICAEGSILTSGKPFGMVEGPSGTFTVSSPISGEVIECNEILKKNPTVVLSFFIKCILLPSNEMITTTTEFIAALIYCISLHRENKRCVTF